MDFTLVGVLPKCGYQFGCWYGTAHLNKALGTYPTPAVPIRPFPEIRSDFEAWLREQTAPFKGERQDFSSPGMTGAASLYKPM